jgi:hypothetical protein
MKILLDENLPRKLKNDFGIDHEVRAEGILSGSRICHGLL